MDPYYNLSYDVEPMSHSMLYKPPILSPFPNSFNKFNKTWTLMYDPLYISQAKVTTFGNICLQTGSHIHV